MDTFASENPKNYQIWYHRRAIVELLGKGDRELAFTAEVSRLAVYTYVNICMYTYLNFASGYTETYITTYHPMLMYRCSVSTTRTIMRGRIASGPYRHFPYGMVSWSMWKSA